MNSIDGLLSEPRNLLLPTKSCGKKLLSGSWQKKNYVTKRRN